jgi:hypothetical protein
VDKYLIKIVQQLNNVDAYNREYFSRNTPPTGIFVIRNASRWKIFLFKIRWRLFLWKNHLKNL